MKNLLQQIDETVSYINEKVTLKPDLGIILGTGLGALVEEIDIVQSLDYTNIPHFPISTVESHSGKLIFGKLANKNVVAMQGRFHFYEGYDMKAVTYPVRVMNALGIKNLFISNAAGSTNEDFKTGHLMILNDHINLQPEHPLRGKNYDSLGPRFPDMLHTYDADLIERALKIAKEKNINCHLGVYASISGPCLETPAEYVYLHRMGADAVGMSTVPEVIVARHMGLKVFAISVITDMGYPKEVIKETTIEDVIAVANEAEPKLTEIMKELIAGL